MKPKAPRNPRVAALRAVVGSDKKPLAGAKMVGKIDPDERIEVTLRVRRRPTTAETAKRTASAAGKPLSRDEFTQLLGADPADIARN